MFRAHVLIIRRSKLHYTASGIITPVGGRLVHETSRCKPKVFTNRVNKAIILFIFITVRMVVCDYVGALTMSMFKMCAVPYGLPTR